MSALGGNPQTTTNKQLTATISTLKQKYPQAVETIQRMAIETHAALDRLKKQAGEFKATPTLLLMSNNKERFKGDFVAVQTAIHDYGYYDPTALDIYVPVYRCLQILEGAEDEFNIDKPEDLEKFSMLAGCLSEAKDTTVRPLKVTFNIDLDEKASNAVQPFHLAVVFNLAREVRFTKHVSAKFKEKFAEGYQQANERSKLSRITKELEDVRSFMARDRNQTLNSRELSQICNQVANINNLVNKFLQIHFPSLAEAQQLQKELFDLIKYLSDRLIEINTKEYGSSAWVIPYFVKLIDILPKHHQRDIYIKCYKAAPNLLGNELLETTLSKATALDAKEAMDDEYNSARRFAKCNLLARQISGIDPRKYRYDLQKIQRHEVGDQYHKLQILMLWQTLDSFDESTIKHSEHVRNCGPYTFKDVLDKLAEIKSKTSDPGLMQLIKHAIHQAVNIYLSRVFIRLPLDDEINLIRSQDIEDRLLKFADIGFGDFRLRFLQEVRKTRLSRLTIGARSELAEAVGDDNGKLDPNRYKNGWYPSRAELIAAASSIMWDIERAQSFQAIETILTNKIAELSKGFSTAGDKYTLMMGLGRVKQYIQDKNPEKTLPILQDIDKAKSEQKSEAVVKLATVLRDTIDTSYEQFAATMLTSSVSSVSGQTVVVSPSVVDSKSGDSKVEIKANDSSGLPKNHPAPHSQPTDSKIPDILPVANASPGNTNATPTRQRVLTPPI